MISQEQISQNEQQTKKPDIKFLHFKKNDIFLEFTELVTLDGLTFNGKDHIVGNFFVVNKNDKLGDFYRNVRIKYNGMTVAYAEDANGDIAISISLKSPKDEYNKKIGRNLSAINLISYLDEAEKSPFAFELYTPYEFRTFVQTIRISDIIDDFSENELHTPISMIQGNVKMSDLKNRYVVQLIKNYVYSFIYNSMYNQTNVVVVR